MASSIAKSLSVGLGEAIQRLVSIEIMRSRGLVTVPKEALAERDMIVEALNTQQLDLGFDCDMDGVPDSVAIFAKSAQTSCCRLNNPNSSRRSTDTSRRK